MTAAENTGRRSFRERKVCDMIDKNLMRLLGDNKKYIFVSAALMLAGLCANIAVTASICCAVWLMTQGAGGRAYLMPAATAAAAMALRWAMTYFSGCVKDRLGRSVKKELREKIYRKMLSLGVRTADEMSMAGLTQAAMEGVEQLDLYYSSYIPQFFYAMLAPLVLFAVTVGLEWRVAVILLCCVPLIPLSIMAVSKYAKKIFAKYWGKYTVKC